MAYGILKNEETVLAYSASATGYPSLASAITGTRERLSRSGSNGSYTKGGIAYTLRPILLFVRKPVGFTYVKRYRKVYYDYVLTRYRKIRIYRPNRTFYYKLIPYEVKVRRFRYEGYTEKRVVMGFKPKQVFKRVATQVTPGMVLGPHDLITRSESIQDNSKVAMAGSMPANPSWSSSLVSVGSRKCRLAEQNSTIGFDAGDYGTSKVPSSVTSALLKSAKYKLVESGRNSTVQLANAALEANSLKSAVLNFTTDAIQTYIAFKRRITSTLDPVQRQKLIDSFLAWSWGIAPTIDDIKKAASAMKQSVWRKYSATVTDTVTIFDAYSTTRFAGTVKGVLEVVVKCGLIVTGSYGAAYLGKQISGGGIIPTAYEAIPFSFAIDWLVPLGTYLAAPEVFPKSSIHSYYETVFIKGDFSGSGVVKNHPESGRVYSGGGEYGFIKTVSSTVRTVPAWNPSLPPPTLKTSGDRFRQAGYSILLTLQRLK